MLQGIAWLGALRWGAVYVALALWVYISGKDLNWDALNYHLYGPLSLVDGRLGQDFFAASFQGYLNPIGYLPFYGLLQLGCSSLVVSLSLAFLHFLNIYLVYRLCVILLSIEGRELKVLSLLLAFSTSLFWSLVGSSFIDLLVTLPMLAGLCLLFRRRDSRQVFLAGVCFGVAAALKLSCAVFAITAILLLLVPNWRQLSQALMLYAGGLLLGFCLFYGYWGWSLWQEFGSPFFPFFNGLFGSTDFLDSNISIRRYVPASLAAALLFPVEAALPKFWVYTEAINPEIKFLVLALLLPVGLIIGGLRTFKGGQHSDTLLWRLGIFWLVSYLCWLLLSANGRYGILLLFLSGPLIVALLVYVCKPIAKIVAWTVLLMQLTVSLVTGVPRWNQAPWTEHWYDFTVPLQLRQSPILYLSASKNSLSFLAEGFHPQSAFVNVSGQYAIGLASPGGKKIQQLLDRHTEVRGLISFEAGAEQLLLLGESGAAELYRDYQDAVYGRFGYRTTDDCVFIRQNNNLKTDKLVLSCRLLQQYVAIDALASADVMRIFTQLEQRCKNLLKPAGGVVEKMPYGWMKFYLNSDATVKIKGGQVILQRSREMYAEELGPSTNFDGSVIGSCEFDRH